MMQAKRDGAFDCLWLSIVDELRTDTSFLATIYDQHVPLALELEPLAYILSKMTRPSMQHL